MSNLNIRKLWDRIPESQATPESLYLNRRHFLKKLGFSAGVTSLVTGCSLGGNSGAAAAPAYGPYGNVPRFWVEKWSELFPAARNSDFKVEGGITSEEIAAGYNNFYEFSTNKLKVKELVSSFEANPWQVEISGEVEKKAKYNLDDLIRMGQLEERLYHFRCVEAWSMNVPWSGFPLARLIEKVKPTSKAKYVRFVTVYRPSQMIGQHDKTYPWPYYEALTLEEAMNELALLTFGMYGHPLNKQNGAPLRLVLPWKFGFKSIKSIVKIEFLEKRPGTLWGDLSREYGFWANINPKFDHPRWSQATERFLNTGERIPTQLYNGYGEYVAGLYDENDRRYFY
ncbi:MAG: protein-methionine-sulfoxide reductase catalytic subunit MsrP [Acidobacteriota bacterium]